MSSQVNSKSNPTNTTDTTTIINLIELLQECDRIKADLTKPIKDMPRLIEGLTELNNMIGMTKVKESIIVQIQFLIVSVATANGKSPFTDHMLNIVLNGGPGVGKTQLGKILSKIWLSIGCLTEPPPKEEPPMSALDALGIVMDNNKLKSKVEHLESKNNKILKSLEVTKYRLTNAKKDINNYKTQSAESLPLRVKLCPNWRTARKHFKSFERRFKRVSEDITDIIEGEEEIIISDVPKVDKESPITVVSREDFVAKYIGQTATKTKQLLLNNLGKVLFIDEAYSLINDEKDYYGKEALTVLNRFMSERPNEIIVIFAGYKDMMDSTIFRAQPGLKRRCTWIFDVDTYSNSEMSKIFRYQASKSEWSFDPLLNLDKFFETNLKTFPNYGGDTEKLLFQCKLVHSKLAFANITSGTGINASIGPFMKTITKQILDDAYKIYMTNANIVVDNPVIHHMYL